MLNQNIFLCFIIKTNKLIYSYIDKIIKVYYLFKKLKKFKHFNYFILFTNLPLARKQI